ncbi:hypothetical protein AC579_6633 [Pseudocercospora musae]|uniref:Uncharacterized protein n=1 Tax=Pseudocercospora musae TaxID=113226 RepID=A0A139I7E4_9PEZI|nr:hypothetical protein AC579_6633 [Pseudocercospora musae]
MPCPPSQARVLPTEPVVDDILDMQGTTKRGLLQTKAEKEWQQPAASSQLNELMPSWPSPLSSVQCPIACQCAGTRCLT